LKFFNSEDSLEKELNDFAIKNKKNLGLVSLDVPLISNLDVWINIALIRQYHQNLPPEERPVGIVFVHTGDPITDYHILDRFRTRFRR